MPIAFRKDVRLLDLPVPSRLRGKIETKLPHARAINVIEVTAGKQSAVNSFRLTEQPGSDRPIEDADEVALAVVQIMQHHSAAKAAADADITIAEGIQFKIEIVRWKDAPGPARPSFSWRWKLIEGLEDEDDDPAVVVMDEGSHEYLHGVIRMLSDQCERQAQQMHDATARVVAMAERMAAPLETVQQQLQFSGGVLQQGMSAMVSALQTRYSYEAHKEIEQAKSERWDQIFRTLGPALQIGMGQVGAHLAEKMKQQSKPANDTEDQDQTVNTDAEKPEKTPPAKAQNSTTTSTPSEQSSDAGSTGDASAEKEVPPVDEIARAFGDLMTDQDWAKMRERFPADFVEHFTATVTAKTAADAVAAYRRARASIDDLGALFAFQGELTPKPAAVVLQVIMHLEALTRA